MSAWGLYFQRAEKNQRKNQTVHIRTIIFNITNIFKPPVAFSLKETRGILQTMHK